MATMTEGVVLNEGINRELKIQVSKLIRAKRQRVFEAWTKPEVMQKWFAPGNMTVPSATADVRVGGAFRVEMHGSPDGVSEERTSVASGVYREIVPNEMLSFTWEGTWSPGEENLVTVSMKDVEGGTEVTIVHERIAVAGSMGAYEQGWMGSLNKLASVLEA